MPTIQVSCPDGSAEQGVDKADLGNERSCRRSQTTFVPARTRDALGLSRAAEPCRPDVSRASAEDDVLAAWNECKVIRSTSAGHTPQTSTDLGQVCTNELLQKGVYHEG